jgi:hypothetical protein
VFVLKRIILLILSLALLGAGAWYLIKIENEDKARIRSLYATVEPLEREREEVQAELDTLESSYVLQMRDYGTIEIFFPTMDEQVFTEAYPVLRELDLVGVLGFSPRYLVNGTEAWNQLSKAEVSRLLSEGWGTCLVYERPHSTFQAWYDNTKQYMENYAVPMPKAIYFIHDDYDPSMDEVLVANGITTVILNGNLADTVSDASASPWITRAMVWGYTGSTTDIEVLGRTDGSNLALTIDFADPWVPARRTGAGRNQENPEKEGFRTTLSSWKEMIYSESALDDMEKIDLSYLYLAGTDEEKNAAMREYYLSTLSPEQQTLLPKFRITTFELAAAYHTRTNTGNSDLQHQLDVSKTELETRLTELDARISTAYEEFSREQNNFTLKKILSALKG